MVQDFRSVRRFGSPWEFFFSLTSKNPFSGIFSQTRHWLFHSLQDLQFENSISIYVFIMKHVTNFPKTDYLKRSNGLTKSPPSKFPLILFEFKHRKNKNFLALQLLSPLFSVQAILANHITLRVKTILYGRKQNKSQRIMRLKLIIAYHH